MGISYDCIILTMNNRGSLVALDLAQRSKKVLYIDVSEMTCWTSKDFSGPFPSHIKRDIDDKHSRKFLSAHNLEKLDKGLSLFTANGIVEVQGEIANYQLDQFNQSEDVQRLKESYSGTISAMTKSLKNNWLLHFFSNYNKSILEQEALSSHQNLKVSDVFGPTFHPVESFSQRQKNRSDLRSKGIEVVEAEKVEIRYEGGKFFVKNGDQAIVSGLKVLNFLESSDLKTVDPELSHQVFHKDPISAIWHWQRFDLKWKTKLDLKSVPSLLFVLPHWDLPWLEDNFMILRKVEEDSQSLWVKTKKQANSEDLVQGCKSILEQYIGLSEFEISSGKLNKGLSLELFPVYESQPASAVRKGVEFYPMGFDQFPSFDLFDMYQSQKQFIDQLLRSQA